MGHVFLLIERERKFISENEAGTLQGSSRVVPIRNSFKRLKHKANYINFTLNLLRNI